MIKHIWGYGKVLFEDLVIGRVLFNHSRGTIKYKEEKIRVENIDRRIIEKHLGWRIEIEVELKNLEEEDYKSFQKLINIINNDMSVISIYPNYREDESNLIADNIRIDNCILDSSIGFEKVKEGAFSQVMKLRFIKRDLVNQIPASVEYEEYLYFKDNSDNLIIDKDNNTIKFKMY